MHMRACVLLSGMGKPHSASVRMRVQSVTICCVRARKVKVFEAEPRRVVSVVAAR